VGVCYVINTWRRTTILKSCPGRFRSKAERRTMLHLITRRKSIHVLPSSLSWGQYLFWKKYLHLIFWGTCIFVEGDILKLPYILNLSWSLSIESNKAGLKFMLMKWKRVEKVWDKWDHFRLRARGSSVFWEENIA